MRLAAVVLTVLAVGCAATPAANEAPPVSEALRAAGFTVRDAGMVEQPFFRVRAHVLVVNDNDLQLYEFPTAAEAAEAAAQVDATGSTIGTTKMSWMASPHFFRKDRTIANYLGSDPKILAELERLFGPQFAGQ